MLAVAPYPDGGCVVAESSPPGTAVSRDANAVYSLGSSEGESARLLRQADELAPESQALLDRAGLRPGQSAIDLGCGPRGVLDLLAARVSPGGRVIGIDADPVHVAMAAGFVAECGLDSVKVLVADARCTGQPSGSFDLVHTRTLLITVPEPAQVITEMVRLARPGGQVASLEPDCEYALGLASEAELDELDAAARAHLDDPRTVAMSHTLFLTWGRRT